MTSLLKTVMCLSGLVLICDSARILAVFPTPSISHQLVFRPFTLELAKRGHDITVITTDPMFIKGQTPPNYKEIDVHDISYNTWEKFVISSSTKTNHYDNLKIGLNLLTIIVIKQLEVPEVEKMLRNKEQRFDLLIMDACARAALLWSHVYKIPVIQISSFGSFPGIVEDVGNPTHPEFYPIQLRQRVNNLTIWDKIVEYYSYYLNLNLFFNQIESDHLELLKVFGPNFRSLSKLKNNIDMTFLNIHPSWDFNRPAAPNVIYLGGSHGNTTNDLQEELKSYLDSSMNGVIYMSFGTNIKPSNLPPHLIKIILKVFAALPYDVLWKWDQDELDGRPKNVKISKWFPQPILLQHSKIKLFITQGGLQSTDEAIFAGVPLIGIPMHTDQWFNTELYVYHQIGLKLDIETMTEEDLNNAIMTVLRDESYRTNIAKLRTLRHNEPQTSLERAIWGTEHVLRHGGAKHLRAPAADMSWAEYYEVELVLIVLVAIILLINILVFLIKYVIKSSLIILKVKLKMN